MNVIQLLRNAVAELKQDGWTKGMMHNKMGQHCALGAIEDAIKVEFGEDIFTTGKWDNPDYIAAIGLYDRANNILMNAIHDEHGNLRFVDVPQFNDDPKTTFADVRKAFSRAIQLAKAG